MAKDATANKRQQRRLSRLYESGVERTTVLVHEECRPSFNVIRPLLRTQRGAKVLARVARLIASEGPTNVAQVTQLSPFRYPGGKTWLIPEIRNWMSRLRFRPSIFVEPFAGGAIASLTVAAEDLADRIVMCERDENVASVWWTILQNPDWLCTQILEFNPTHESVRRLLDTPPETHRERAFQTIVRNRTQRGGILAPGAGLVKNGENGKGLRSRWYPQTLVKRIRCIYALRRRIEFVQGDGFKVIERFLKTKDAVFYIDPPYTAGGKSAGKRLYLYNDMDHDHLFDLISSAKGTYLMSYEDSEDVRRMAAERAMKIEKIPMKNTHHAVMSELVITPA